jgi:O-acetylhomoserine (thiol)-lyase
VRHRKLRADWTTRSASPFLCRPIEWGADIAALGDQVHRRSRDEHRRRCGGFGAFNWSNGRFPVVADPSPAITGCSFTKPSAPMAI